jgi:peptidoglycan hydrolase-like amidase
MCQYCAKGFADRGDNWREIVQRFYPGATLKQLY